MIVASPGRLASGSWDHPCEASFDAKTSLSRNKFGARPLATYSWYGCSAAFKGCDYPGFPGE